MITRREVLTDTPQTSDIFVRHARELWILTVAFFVFGDLVTTAVGVASGGIAEAGPIAAPIIHRYGFLSMIPLKLVVMGLAFSLWKLVPSPARIGIPLGLATVGVLVTGWNLIVLLFVYGQ